MADGYAYSVKQLADIWNVSARHVYSLCVTNQLGHLRLGKSIIRIREADKEAFEARQWHAPNPTNQPTSSSSAEVVSISASGKLAPGSAFQRGQRTAAKRKSS